MFTAPFSCLSNVGPGDFTTCTVDGTEYTARIKFDLETTPDDFECYSPDQVTRWKCDEWWFVGIAIEAKRGGVLLSDHLASLWGVESNSTPEYLLEAANDLLREAVPLANEARKRVALARA